MLLFSLEQSQSLKLFSSIKLSHIPEVFLEFRANLQYNLPQNKYELKPKAKFLFNIKPERSSSH